MASALVTVPLAVAKAFSPGHITGIVELAGAESQDYLYAGSKGAGFSIDKGIETAVEVYDSKRQSYNILINGSRADPADVEVSSWVVEEFFKITGKGCHIKIDHNIGIPVGYGLGSSGAAALSLSYALDAAMGTGLGIKRAAQIAHRAEIECNTGLGTVIAEYAGGFEIRTGVGAPGIGRIQKKELDGYKAIILCRAPISTKLFLSKNAKAINGLGSRMLDALAQSEEVEDFVEFSYRFADQLGFIWASCREPVQALRSAGFGCGIALFGETVFTIVKTEQAPKVEELLRNFGGMLLVCNIDNTGARRI
jgi:pantoate kinase